LRAVGHPLKRFEEDKLRILRAVRFAAQLDFAIEETTLLAVREAAPRINVVSPERITEEIQKLLRARSAANGVEILRDVGLLRTIWPELAFAEDDSRWGIFSRMLPYVSGSLEMFVALALTVEGRTIKVPF